MRKKRRDAVLLFREGEQLSAAALRDAADPPGRAARLTAGLAALWPAPLAASFLSGRDEVGLAVTDEAGHSRPDWHAALRAQLDEWTKAGGPVSAAAAPTELGLADHFLHGGAIAWADRRYGALALALHKRTTDAMLAQALLAHLAAQLGFRLFQEETERQAQAQHRNLADLTNLVGHEFNNVLNSLGLQIAALSQRGLTAELFPELVEVRKQVAEAGRMVRRLQDFCHKGAPPRQAADLNRAVRAGVADSALAGRVRLELQPGLPPVQGAMLDLERLAGVLAAASAAVTPPGAEPVVVRTGRGEGATLWLRVEDAGPEPEESLMPQLFEPFVPVRPADDGVALPLAKSIARRLGGVLRGERRIGGGMMFIAELRAAE